MNGCLRIRATACSHLWFACRKNAIGADGAKAVVAVAKFDMPALKELDMSFCKLGEKEGAEHAAQLLQFNETLEVRNSRHRPSFTSLFATAAWDVCVVGAA